MFGQHEWYKGNLPSVLTAALTYATASTVWSWAIAWFIFCCATGHLKLMNRFLSSAPFGPLSALSYLAYLLHPILIAVDIGRARERSYYSHYDFVSREALRAHNSNAFVAVDGHFLENRGVVCTLIRGARVICGSARSSGTAFRATEEHKQRRCESARYERPEARANRSG